MLRKLAAAIRQLSLFDPAPPPAALRIPPLRPEAPAPRPAQVDAPPSADASFADLCFGPYAHVTVETGRRLRDSWRVTWTRRREALRLRVPEALASAPVAVKLAALRWAILVSYRPRRPDPALTQERRRLEALIRDSLKGDAASASAPVRSRRLAANRRRLERLQPRGTFHDLEAILAAVNARYFGGSLAARITWAARLGGLSTHRMAEDGEGKPYHLLTISRGYDCPEATPEIVGGVVYHECLHAVIPPRVSGGRRVVHGRDFRMRERQYEHFEVWRKWHREVLPKVLRRMLRAR